MPELPEVTTTVKQLRKEIKNTKIVDIWSSYKSPHYVGKENIKDPKYFSLFKKQIIGKKIVDVRRVGKNILIDLDDTQTILVHMKMTGSFLIGPYTEKDKYIRMIFNLKGNGFGKEKVLAFSDLRKFAKVTLNTEDLKLLGPDPTTDIFTVDVLRDRLLLKPNGRIKNVLMDQTVVSGIGNIYSDESLWLSKINPETKPKSLTAKQFSTLHKNIRKVLKLGIELEGDSTSDYIKPDGTKGGFQLRHKVYKRKGEKCLRKDCNGTIVRKVIGGRSAHFCNTCQKK
jgi:formamidopyrimidine-DNA glycosylase